MPNQVSKENLKKLKRYYEDRANWRPPGYAQIAKYMGWASKGSVYIALREIKNENIHITSGRSVQQDSKNESRK